jgi:hypothetical protein
LQPFGFEDLDGFINSLWLVRDALLANSTMMNMAAPIAFMFSVIISELAIAGDKSLYHSLTHRTIRPPRMRLLFDNTVVKVLARIASSLSRPLWGQSVDRADILMTRLASEKDERERNRRTLLYPEQ